MGILKKHESQLRLFFSSYSIKICDRFLFIKTNCQKNQKNENLTILRKIKSLCNDANKGKTSSEKLINDENEGVEEIKKIFATHQTNRQIMEDLNMTKYNTKKIYQNVIKLILLIIIKII